IKNLNDSDKFNIYKRLSKIKRLYDVSDTLGWIVDLGSSGYWFEYSNLWNYENYHPFIVNTHVTALHIANDLGRLALIMSDTVTFNFWRVIVDQGLKGFYYFINDSLNWKSNQSGRRELVYKKGDVSLDEYSDVTIEEFNDLKEELIATDYLPQIEEILFIKYHH
ncbi:MAG: hypothetical protein AB1728_13545, partial [Bacteroidota bacterium]